MSERTDAFLKSIEETSDRNECPGFSFSGQYFNKKQQGILEQLVNATKDRGEAPYILFPEDYWDIAKRTERGLIPEGISPFTITVVDPRNGNAIDNYLTTLREYSKEYGEVGDIAYLAEKFSKRAMGVRLSSSEKAKVATFLERNCPNMVKTSWRDKNFTYSLAVEEYCRARGIDVEITAAIDSGKCSMSFESIMDSVRAGAFGGDTERFEMMEECVKQLCLVDENGVLSVSTRSQLRQIDTFDEKKANLEKTLRELYQKAAANREAEEKLRFLQREMVRVSLELAEKMKNEREKERKRDFERAQRSEEERAEEYRRIHNMSVGKDVANENNQRLDRTIAVTAAALMACRLMKEHVTLIKAGFDSTEVRGPENEEHMTQTYAKLNDIEKKAKVAMENARTVEKAFASMGRDSGRRDSRDRTNERSRDENTGGNPR